MNNNTKTILALLSGAFAGVALGIYFSSGKGAKMKDEISGSAEDAFDSMKEKDAMSEFKQKLYQKASRNHNGTTGHGQGKKNKQHS